MKSLLLAILLLLPGSAVWAQGMAAGATREVNFLYEVKVIDEFIERFNDAPNSFLRKEYLRYGKPINFTRQDLVRFLFEKDITDTDSVAHRFIAQVTDSLHPQKISFNDSNWYAHLDCFFNQDGLRFTIPLVLRVELDSNGSTRWLICGIGDAPMLQNIDSNNLIAEQMDNRKFISPSDYATNFIELHHILKPGFEGVNYLTPALFETSRGRKFCQLIRSGKLKFDGPGAMRFYFFQIPNYSFTVERFVRQTTHSGWLISNIRVCSDSEKLAEKEKLLQRTL
ncbi:MAG: hypothetical protein JST06_01190 [Bacteroidetes bacterium]|nr:hypothetical protein [Bacteroidota bacterium]MBS1629568.1 hypothetical protein [Bacteroidota bacterium]